MTVFFSIVAGLISIYSLLILVRILLTWFRGPHSLGRPAEVLSALTDPYLDWFRRFDFLRLGNLDLSAVAGLLALSVAGNIAGSLAQFGRITLGIILAMLVSGVWSALSFLLLIFFFLSLIRFIGIQAGINPASPAWRTMDYILNPVLLPLARMVLKDRPASYATGLLIGCGFFLAGRVLGGLAVSLLTGALARVPF